MLPTCWLIVLIIIVICAGIGKCLEFYNLNKLSQKTNGEQENEQDYVIFNDNMLNYSE
jgi:hypothetical protein